MGKKNHKNNYDIDLNINNILFFNLQSTYNTDNQTLLFSS